MNQQIIQRVASFWDNIETKKYFWGDWIDVRYFLCSELSKYKRKTILDVACQTGAILNCLDESNKIYGIDNDENAIKTCRKLNPKANLITGDIFANNFENEKFDIIILANVLPGYDYSSNQNPRNLINLCYQWLKPGGLLYLTTPNGDNSYFKNKGKIKIAALKELLSSFNYQIYGWNPFPIQAHKLLRFFPVAFSILENNLKNSKESTRNVSFYVIARKK